VTAEAGGRWSAKQVTRSGTAPQLAAKGDLADTLPTRPRRTIVVRRTPASRALVADPGSLEVFTRAMVFLP